ncbi:hypothetical protein [Frigoribacterium sp. CG_9.8]|uniref:hypothetical protein n=1 Tax=Frigoribacterium sp. CG_9.8 TaxID=2787733 RepID=UPI0018CB988B|nr:hypothetical protein [Frigoribacterium sp. CG_9.8]MBG6106623.1 hypothetical protein [Frigoribacterium sp. CG_9.8]
MSYNITSNDLDLADDRTYEDYIVRSAFQDGKIWTLMLEPEHIDRTHESILKIKSSLEQQLGQAKLFQKGGDENWRRRITNLLRMTETYIADVKSEVKRLDREEYRESAEGERDRWKSIAGLLVDLLHANPALKLIQTPAGMNAAEWGTIRTEKREQAAA